MLCPVSPMTVPASEQVLPRGGGWYLKQDDHEKEMAREPASLRVSSKMLPWVH